MTVSKLRAATVVLCVGLALGLSVFATSRLFLRAALEAQAISAAREFAERLSKGDGSQLGASGPAITGYVFVDADGAASDGTRVAGHAPLWRILVGFDAPLVRRVVVPLGSEEEATRSLLVEFDQAGAAEALGRIFSAFAWVTLGLAVLATLMVTAAVTRRGGRRRRAFDPNAVARDPLTDLPTRQGFQEALADAVARGRGADQQIGLMIVELDDFGKVNEVWGHEAGDAVLKGTAERLGRFASGPAALARISGDAFALIIERDATSHALRRLAERICEALAAPHAVGSSSIVLGSSYGAAFFPVNADDPEALFRAADTALRHANDDRAGVAFFDTAMEKRIARRAVLERDIKRALDNHEFVVFYQPQKQLASGEMRGHEALVRWERPGEGILPPHEFLPVARETGLIRPLGDWVLRTACRDAATWLDAGTVAVNFSAEQFRFQDVPETVAKALAESGLPAERLEIEVPESLFLQHSPEVMDQLQRIKALGVRIAMDNFGAGYSSLASLAQFPFDKVKIDRSFVGQLTEDAGVAAIVASVVGLGRSLSVDVTAEGVETDEQVALLKAAGCSIVQGFLFGVPSRDKQPADEAKAEAPAGAAAANTA
jgi:diguanylate cyclase (GGDEF)-like protein